MANGDEVSNNQIIFRDYISGFPKETDMILILLKNLYLSCDPYMRGRMTDAESYIAPFTPGLPVMGYGVAKVIDSGNPNYKQGDCVWGITGWEQYSLLENPEPSTLVKIKYTDRSASFLLYRNSWYAWSYCICWLS
ncbi:hypothetical protein MKX03_015907 [Papaver bracteatum]|nr:hypothetical protein MKX03_015907 [Papaver bracteatum]